ncbi:pyruvate carboxylase subunit B [Lacrimispora sp. 38-1]|uniref:pyruvate carboxylase subunit B n=1 Tax=Lacrimispora sp. 38-1 TaxID=3125778 RepID=UPI003CECDE2E
MRKGCDTLFWNRKNQIPTGIGAADFAGAGSPLKFNSVEFRDGQQSLIATRMTTEDMIPLLSRMDAVGYDSMEMWGGATFDVAIRFLKEDPWERVRTFKKYVKKTPLKMVLRAQNLVGYKAYPDDIVEKFIEKAAEAGIDIFLIFDALQDLRNCESAFRAVKKAGKKIEGSVQYNISPFHTTEVFVQNALEQEHMGASLMHVEDMAGLMTPNAAYELISALKKALKIPVHLHCHCTGGMAEMAYWEAIRAGVDGLDVCVSSMSMGPAHPPIESFVSALKGTSRDPKIDVGQFKSINKDFIDIRKKYSNFETKLIGVDVGCLEHQIPGGMLSNLESQLFAMKLYDRLPEVLEEVTRVRADMGYPPLATPSSQMCGAQATTNVLTGNRYSMVSKEIKDYCRGMYGMPPGPVDPVLLEKALGEEIPSTKKPADLLEPGFEKAKAESSCLARTEEDILTHALFPNYAPDFFKVKYGL